MGNSESTSSPHQNCCKEAETKLKKCVRAHLASKIEEMATKEREKDFKAAFDDDHDKYADYMKRGACNESYMTWVKNTDKGSDDKYMRMMECMEAHSDYYHKFLDFYIGGQERVMKEFKSIYPFRKDDETPIRVQEFLEDCCKEQYLAVFRCYLKNLAEVLTT
ncbi:GCK domain-containing protein [Raphanus sativus]|nr:GCK domain-containing protein [Raphanus sativus]